MTIVPRDGGAARSAACPLLGSGREFLGEGSRHAQLPFLLSLPVFPL